MIQLYKKQHSEIKVAGTTADWLKIKKGVRQGWVISPYLSNIVAEMVIRKTFEGYDKRITILKRRISNLGYADGIILLV